ncbi:MAG: hypothetical protein J5929_05175, partial [Eubacterium sp.]|nr:hypothetical protein [Eubacterium sp.]
MREESPVARKITGDSLSDIIHIAERVSKKRYVEGNFRSNIRETGDSIPETFHIAATHRKQVGYIYDKPEALYNIATQRKASWIDTS